MSTTPAEIYQLAVDLYKSASENEEPLLRAIVSRAYYAAYHAAVAAHPTKAPKGGNAHQGFFNNLHAGGAEKLARQLINLHASRKSADYDLSEKFVKRDAGMALGACERIFIGIGQPNT